MCDIHIAMYYGWNYGGQRRAKELKTRKSYKLASQGDQEEQNWSKAGANQELEGKYAGTFAGTVVNVSLDWRGSISLVHRQCGPYGPSGFDYFSIVLMATFLFECLKFTA